MTAQRGTCGTCFWWKAQADKGGFCERFPPTVLCVPSVYGQPAQLENHRPYTASNERCGEWKSRDPQHARSFG